MRSLRSVSTHQLIRNVGKPDLPEDVVTCDWHVKFDREDIPTKPSRALPRPLSRLYSCPGDRTTAAGLHGARKTRAPKCCLLARGRPRRGTPGFRSNSAHCHATLLVVSLHEQRGENSHQTRMTPPRNILRRHRPGRCKSPGFRGCDGVHRNSPVLLDEIPEVRLPVESSA
jgi:hypothetical protein